RHDQNERIPLGRAHHSEADSGVAARRFDYSLSRLELSGLLGVLDNAERETILHRAERVECFDLYVKVDAFGSKSVDFHDGRVADRLENAGETSHRSVLMRSDFGNVLDGRRHRYRFAVAEGCRLDVCAER